MGKCPVPAHWLILQSLRKQLWSNHGHKQCYLRLANHCISLSHSMNLNPALVTTIAVLLMSVPLCKCAVAVSNDKPVHASHRHAMAMVSAHDASMLCRDPPTTHPDVRATCRKKDLRCFRMYHPSRGPLSNTTWHTIVSLQALKRILFQNKLQSDDLIQTYRQSVPGFPPLPCPATGHPFLHRCDSWRPRCRKDFSLAGAEKIVWHLKTCHTETRIDTLFNLFLFDKTSRDRALPLSATVELVWANLVAFHVCSGFDSLGLQD